MNWVQRVGGGKKIGTEKLPRIEINCKQQSTSKTRSRSSSSGGSSRSGRSTTPGSSWGVGSSIAHQVVAIGDLEKVRNNISIYDIFKTIVHNFGYSNSLVIYVRTYKYIYIFITSFHCTDTSASRRRSRIIPIGPCFRSIHPSIYLSIFDLPV